MNLYTDGLYDEIKDRYNVHMFNENVCTIYLSNDYYLTVVIKDNKKEHRCYVTLEKGRSIYDACDKIFKDNCGLNKIKILTLIEYVKTKVK